MTLRELVAWHRRDPGRYLGSHLSREMDRFLDEVFRGFDAAPVGRPLRGFEPRIDVEELAKEVRVTVELPGLEQKDFEIHLEGDVLRIRGEKRDEGQEQGAGWYERSTGSFERAIRLPTEVDADAVSASFKDGILRITLPKARESQVRTIPVRTE